MEPSSDPKITDLPKSYEAAHVEPRWYQFWEENGFFKASNESKKPPYCISIPPPNVTGSLHMGHALGDTLQDVLIRWKRMSGYEALWIPGTDHAGIATQTVVERYLIKTQGKTRKEFEREEFLNHVWKWKEEKQETILGQIKRLGSSCDWSRLRFTMDEGCNRAVRILFKKLYDDGLIYRDYYLVNWDPVTQTALADDEVEYEERNSFLWYIYYPLTDGSGYVLIATTRPETMLGDTAVAVSPNDDRYAHLVGKTLTLPFVNREIPIIADHHVNPLFGTGAVKITPAHDPNDYQIALRHGLPMINIMTPDGYINERGVQFAGSSMEEGRKLIVEALESLKLIEKTEPYIHLVGISYRSKAKIEPFLSDQWFVRMKEFGSRLRSCITEGRAKLFPQNWESTYFHWIDNLRDWCISRQLWWGHRIPVWYHRADKKRMICYEGQGAPPEVIAAPNDWYQDEDVLDTWFSAAIWPLSILGWPEETSELKQFYPNAVLITGNDILFFWVARMLLMGEYLMEKTPFPEIFLHGLIYGKSYWKSSRGGSIQYVNEEERIAYDLGKPVPDDVSFKWEKMSKTKGNVIDPIEIIDQYGADAMRMALCVSSGQGREIDLDRRRFEDFKNFANKIWNGARFALLNLDGERGLHAHELSKGIDENHLDLEDRWILSRLEQVVASVNNSLASYAFDKASLEAYDFFWKEFCSYYLEIVKPVLNEKAGTPIKRHNKQKLLLIILSQVMRLLHPMAPFITEELFQLLKTRYENVESKDSTDAYTLETLQALKAPACIVAPYPTFELPHYSNKEIDNAFLTVSECIRIIRNLRGEMQLAPSIAVDLNIVGDPELPIYKHVESHLSIIKALIRLDKVSFQQTLPSSFGATGSIAVLSFFIPLPPQYKEQELQRLEKERLRLESSLKGLLDKLQNQAFLERAPSALITEQRQRAHTIEGQLREVENAIQRLSAGNRGIE